MPIITISRQLGSGGVYIAHQLAQKLNLHYIDKELIANVARLAKVDETQIEQFDQEKFNKLKVVFSQIAFPIPGSGIIYPFAAAGYMEPYWFPSAVTEISGLDDKKYLQLTQTVIRNFAEEGNAVIMGRGGSILLKDFPGAVHLRIV
ncbi:MAG: cytidylate kinase-like family protein, partial [bacterium]|nr:cytidylate kinase-like family protein [bacterium]